MLRISTADDETLAEMITPQEIALGAGDAYLLEMNRFFAERGLRAYIRPLGEPNRCLNAWSAVYCDGSPPVANTPPTGTRRRSGGSPRSSAAARRSNRSTRPSRNSACRRWPDQGRNRRQPAGGPGQDDLEPAARRLAARQGNFPGNYWPGSYLVDWAGTDFYSNYPVWGDLNHFYEGEQWRDKPVAITEWAVPGTTNRTSSSS